MEPWTVSKLLDWSQNFLVQKQVGTSAKLDCEILLAKALQKERIELYMHRDLEPSEEERAAFRDLLKKRAEHMPIAYLVGQKWFWKDPFTVNPDVLIPRPETELMIEEASKRFSISDPIRVLDIGTGSGCILLSMAREFPQMEGTGIDCSEKALAVAQLNAKDLKQDHLQWLHVDFQKEDLSLPPFDLIVCNPPYIDKDDPHCAPGPRLHEPSLALFAEQQGLGFFQTLAARVPALLKPKGLLMVEHGFQQQTQVEDIFSKVFQVEAKIQDLAGHPRLMILTV